MPAVDRKCTNSCPNCHQEVLIGYIMRGTRKPDEMYRPCHLHEPPWTHRVDRRRRRHTFGAGEAAANLEAPPGRCPECRPRPQARCAAARVASTRRHSAVRIQDPPEATPRMCTPASRIAGPTWRVRGIRRTVRRVDSPAVPARHAPGDSLTGDSPGLAEARSGSAGQTTGQRTAIRFWRGTA